MSTELLFYCPEWNQCRYTFVYCRLDKGHIQRYRDLCGCERQDIPLCYAETLFFKLIFQLVTSAKFGLSPLGMTISVFSVTFR